LHICVELFGKFVKVIDVKDSLVDVNVDSDIKIFPCVIVVKFSDDFGYFLSFQKDALRDARVFYLGFSDENSQVRQVVVY
jgi:hypothetical protein